MKRLLLQIAAVVVTVVSFGWPSPASDAHLEYEVKAAFLYNFAKFVGWPERAFDRPDDPLVFCIHGTDRFGESIDAIVDGRKAHGREIVVRHDAGAEDLDGCHLLFLTGNDSRSVAQIVHELGDTSVLTVGEAPSFADDGGIIGLVVDGGKVKFEINATSAERAGLRVSSQLLKLARSVKK
jgi:hypothetical protein